MIDQHDDPRLGVFFGLQDRDLRGQSNLFVVEGMRTVQRLLGSRFPCVAVAATPTACERLEREAGAKGALHGAAVLYEVEAEVLAATTGFHLHQGVVAAAVARRWPTLPDVLSQLYASKRDRPWLLGVCPELSNVDNLGQLIRSAAGLGVDALVLGPRCHEPLYRRCVRVSMGSVFDLPMVQSADVAGDLAWAGHAYGLAAWAADGGLGHTPLRDWSRPGRVAVVLGNESTGVADDVLAVCAGRVGIAMHRGVDSLNVATAGALMFHAIHQAPPA